MGDMEVTRVSLDSHDVPSVELSVKCSVIRARQNIAQELSSRSIDNGDKVSVEYGKVCIGIKRDLNSGFFGKAETSIVVFTKALVSNDWKKYDEIKAIANSPNLIFLKKFVIDWFYEEKQELRFDVHNKSGKVVDSIFCTLWEILARSGREFKKELTFNGKKMGRLEILAEELNESNDVIFMKWGAERLKGRLIGKPNPFLRFYRRTENNSLVVCHESEANSNTCNPMWKQMEVSMQTLCNNDLDRTITVEIRDKQKSGADKLLGNFETNVRKLLIGPCSDNAYESDGQKIILKAIQRDRRYTFIDYLSGGTQLNVVMAVDFTSVTSTKSPHFITPNQYAMAIKAVGEVVQDYDFNKNFPAYGFGARIPPTKQVSYDFPLNFDEGRPCHGIEEVLKAYEMCLKKVSLAGPANFTPMIRKVAGFAKEAPKSDYYVLIIFTQGCISDQTAAIEEIVKAARLPLSIVIVGIGKGTFQEMNELDGDVDRLSHRNVEAERDIVQFVRLRDHLAKGRTEVQSRRQLAKEVLAEIPCQLVQYMTSKGIKP